MSQKTHRTEIHIETHEIKIIRFGKRVDADSDDPERAIALIADRASARSVRDEQDHEGREIFFNADWADQAD